MCSTRGRHTLRTFRREHSKDGATQCHGPRSTTVDAYLDWARSGDTHPRAFGPPHFDQEVGKGPTSTTCTSAAASTTGPEKLTEANSTPPLGTAQQLLGPPSGSLAPASLDTGSTTSSCTRPSDPVAGFHCLARTTDYSPPPPPRYRRT